MAAWQRRASNGMAAQGACNGNAMGTRGMGWSRNGNVKAAWPHAVSRPRTLDGFTCRRHLVREEKLIVIQSLW